MGAERIHSDHRDKAQGRGRGNLPSPLSSPQASESWACPWTAWSASPNTRLGSAGRKCVKALPVPGSGHLGAGSCRASEPGRGGRAAARQPRRCQAHCGIRLCRPPTLYCLWPAAQPLPESWCYPWPRLDRAPCPWGTPVPGSWGWELSVPLGKAPQNHSLSGVRVFH